MRSLSHGPTPLLPRHSRLVRGREVGLGRRSEVGFVTHEG